MTAPPSDNAAYRFPVSVKGVLLEIGQPTIGVAQMQELRSAL